MNYRLRTLLQRFDSCKYPKSKMAAVWCPRWRPKWPPFSYFDHTFLTIHTRNTSKVSKHMFVGIRNLPETLLRCFDFCKYPKSKMATKMAAVLYFDYNFPATHAGNTGKVSKHMFEVWTIYLKHYYSVLALSSTQTPKWSLFGVQDGVQNGHRLHILNIIYTPTIHTRNTRKVSNSPFVLRYLNSTWNIIKVSFIYYCRYPKSKMAAQMAASYFDHNFLT